MLKISTLFFVFFKNGFSASNLAFSSRKISNEKIFCNTFLTAQNLGVGQLLSAQPALCHNVTDFYADEPQGFSVSVKYSNTA